MAEDSGPSEQTKDLLAITLSAAVPLWIDRLRSLTDAERLDRARVCGDVIAEKGDIIQFKSKRTGETAAAFNRLAEGLACLAFARGGVDFLDMHFEANPPTESRLSVPCEDCSLKEGETNHPPGMIFVGWGMGWQTCSACGGTGKRPSEPKRADEDEVGVG